MKSKGSIHLLDPSLISRKGERVKSWRQKALKMILEASEAYSSFVCTYIITHTQSQRPFIFSTQFCFADADLIIFIIQLLFLTLYLHWYHVLVSALGIWISPPFLFHASLTSDSPIFWRDRPDPTWFVEVIRTLWQITSDLGLNPNIFIQFWPNNTYLNNRFFFILLIVWHKFLGCNICWLLFRFLELVASCLLHCSILNYISNKY